ncbi:MAG: hypothetical protein WBO09_00995 [Methylocystis silviterrae]
MHLLFSTRRGRNERIRPGSSKVAVYGSCIAAKDHRGEFTNLQATISELAISQQRLTGMPPIVGALKTVATMAGNLRSTVLAWQEETRSRFRERGASANLRC